MIDHNVLAYGDNLDYLQGLASESVDLVYLDPPFNSNRDYNAIHGADAQVRAFEDTFTWGDDDKANLRAFAKINPDLGRFLISLGDLMPKDGLYAYLIYMARRLQELHRILKPTGSIYLHVDDTASHYLKLIMDSIFGSAQYQNNISWHRANPKNGKLKQFGRCTDTIFFYSKGKKWTFNAQYSPLSEAYIKKMYRYEDAVGKYRTGPLMDPNGNPNLMYDYVASNGVTYPAPGRGWRTTLEGMQELDRQGKLHFPRKAGGVLSKKFYLHESKGVPMADIWSDIPCVGKPDYPTQKPIELLERVILSSSNPGDVVLDPFMGSGTTCLAAAMHDRKFIGIDLTPIAVAQAKGRLEQAGMDLLDLDEWGSPQDIESAKLLYETDKRAFDCWSIMRCSAMPADLGDRVIGLRRYMRFDRKGLHNCTALYAVSLDEPPTINDVDRIKRIMKSKKAEMGFLICFELPDAAVLDAVKAAGEVKLNGDHKKAPKLQVITVQDVIDQNYLATEVFNHERVQRQSVVSQMELV